jgi:hypothetical protein
MVAKTGLPIKHSDIEPMKGKKKGILHRIAEMVGRVQPVSVLFGRHTYNLYGAEPSLDYTKVNYHLARSLYYVSKVKNPESGTEYGEQYLLGAGFAKPIVNIAAGFMIGSLPDIRIEGVDEGKKTEIETLISEFLDKNHSKLYKLFRNSMRDGDDYVQIDGDDLKRFPPEQIDIVINKITGELEGFDRTVIVQEEQENGREENIKYKTEYRINEPTGYKKTYRLQDNEKTYLPEYSDTEPKEYFDIVGFHNELEEGVMLYGNSEYQSIYYYIANYHAILAAAIKNNIYNGTSVPYLTGVGNTQTFMEANGEKADDGKYKLRWDAKKLLIGPDKFDIKFASATDTSQGADKLLNLLFWLIAQNSETPEFAFGTAVRSSMASVSEQMPVLVQKVVRKQKEYTDPLLNLIKLFLMNNGVDTETLKINIIWKSLVDKDMKVNIEILRFLADEGIITDKSKLQILGMGEYIQDIDKELTEAKKESDERQKAFLEGSARKNQVQEEQEKLQEEES